jgi:dihydrofolate synthase/folylpolyglutamate synthase
MSVKQELLHLTGKFQNLIASYDWLDSHNHYEQNLDRVQYDTRHFDLQLFRERLAQLGSPQDQLRTIHVAGTRGKGSTALFLECLLMASGLKTAVFTSPHLNEYRERIRINGQLLEPGLFCRLLGRIALHADPISEHSPNFRTVFEYLTALFFCAAEEAHVDWAIIETGLGGRLDSTNIIQYGPVLLTRIGLEHTHLLGDNLELIAAEKAAILKAGGWAVCADQSPNEEVMRVFRKRALEQDHADLYPARDICPVQDFQAGRHGLTMKIGFEGRTLNLCMKLLGTYQVENIQNALAMLECLRQRGLIQKVDDACIGDALAQMQVAGRMQLLEGPPDIILDSAHCITGASALADSLNQHFGHDTAHLVVAMMRDKDHEGFFRGLSSWPGWQHVWCFQGDTPRSMPADDLAAIAGHYFKDVSPVATTSDMLELIRNDAEKLIRVVITGSIFHLGQFVPTIRGNGGKYHPIRPGASPATE